MSIDLKKKNTYSMQSNICIDAKMHNMLLNDTVHNTFALKNNLLYKILI